MSSPQSISTLGFSAPAELGIKAPASATMIPASAAMRFIIVVPPHLCAIYPPRHTHAQKTRSLKAQRGPGYCQKYRSCPDKQTNRGTGCPDPSVRLGDRHGGIAFRGYPFHFRGFIRGEVAKLWKIWSYGRSIFPAGFRRPRKHLRMNYEKETALVCLGSRPGSSTFGAGQRIRPRRKCGEGHEGNTERSG